VSEIYIIPTPIGNLGDITFRAVEILKNVDLIYAEDTRTSQKLLSHYEITKKTISYHQHNEHKVVDNIIENIVNNNLKVALVSDAGTPGISDPGFLLINKAKEKGILVFCLPGPTALIPAILQSGFASDEFHFFGFLPHKKGRKKKLKNILENNSTIILYESPHRLIKLLEQIKEQDNNSRQISVSRELTKIYEENVQGYPEQLINHFSEKKIKGEIVVVIDKISNK
jgi:16S rRNA (cytidine1402-2'-O)-methyltransferase